MEPAKLPINASINFNLFNEQNNPDATCYIDSHNNLYQINFYKKKSEIFINCHNTSEEINKIYSYKLSLDEVKRTNVFRTFDQILNFFNGLNQGSNNLLLEKGSDSVLLKITINDKSKMNLRLIKEMSSLKDVIYQLQNLIKENENLKNRVAKLEEENKKMKLNYFYNSFDTKAYKLENLFENLQLNDECKIIKNKYDLRLINQGIKFLFNKIIKNLKLMYRLNDDFNPKIYADLSSQLNFYLIVILTKDNRKFGSLFNKYMEKNIIINNNHNMMNNNMMNNNMMGNNMMGNNNMVMMNNMNNMQNNNNIQHNNNMGNMINIQNNNGVRFVNNMQNMNGVIDQQHYNGMTTTNTIFNSASNINEYFVFSLDYYKLYYCDKTNTNAQNVPNFTVLYDPNRQCIYGNETCPNDNLASSQILEMSQRSIQSNPIIGQQINIVDNNAYKLSGKNEFNVKSFEIFSIEIDDI